MDSDHSVFASHANTCAFPFLIRPDLPEADLSLQTGAGEHIGDLPLVAKIARESTAKIYCPTSRWRIENRFQTQSAFLQPLMPAPQPWRIALLRSLRYALSSSG